MTIAISQLQANGVTFEAFEAVAIAQQLIEGLRGSPGADEVQPSDGPPSPDNVCLREDGSVAWRGCRVTASVAEVGIFLDALLSRGPVHVPVGVRETIARARLEMDVPPFDSLDALSRDLSRHEQGDRALIIRRALARANRHGDRAAGESPADPRVGDRIAARAARG